MKSNLKNKGSILILSVLILAVILSIAFTLLAIFIPKIRVASDPIYSAIAASAADSALEWCLYAQRGNLLVNDDPTSGMLSQSGLTGFIPAGIVDNDTATSGWHTDNSNSSAWLRIDLGSGNSKDYVGIRIFTSTAGYAGEYDVEYSTTGSAPWINVSTDIYAPSALGWSEFTWESVGARRYWRLRLRNTPGPGAWLNELEMLSNTAGPSLIISNGATFQLFFDNNSIASCVPGQTPLNHRSVGTYRDISRSFELCQDPGC